MNSRDTHHPHDKLFRAAMQYPEVARDFLMAHCPPDILSKINLDSVKACPNTFIDDELRLSQSDVLLQATLLGTDRVIYILIEHQSKPDPTMPFRLLKYVIRIWEYHQSQHPQKQGLPFPLIFPMVFYTGKNVYRAPKTMWELCGEHAELMRHIIQEPFLLIDVNNIPVNRLLLRRYSGTMEFVMSHQFRISVSRGLELIADNLDRFMLQGMRQFVLQLLEYIFQIDDEHRTYQEIVGFINDKMSPKIGDEIVSLAEILRQEGRDEVVGLAEILRQEGRDEVMSLAEILRQEGRQRGLQEGELKANLKTAQRLLAEGADPIFVARATELPLEQIRKIKLSLELLEN